MTTTLPELNFVEPARAAACRAARPPDQPGVRPRRRPGRDADVDHLETAPACALPGAIQSPGLAAVERRGRRRAHRRRRRPRRSRRRRRSGRRRRSRSPGAVDRRRSPPPPAPSARRSSRCRAARRRSPCASSSRAASKATAAPGELRQHRLRVLAEPLRATARARRRRGPPGAAAARRRCRRRRCCPCRRRSRSAPRARARRPRARAPRPRAPSARATGSRAPRSPTRSVARISSGVGQRLEPAAGGSSQQHRHRAGHALGVRERDRHLDAELRRAPPPGPRAARAAAVAAAEHLDVVPVAVAQRERLGDGLLGAEAHGEVARRLAALGRERALAVGEEPLGQPRAAGRAPARGGRSRAGPGRRRSRARRLAHRLGLPIHR